MAMLRSDERSRAPVPSAPRDGAPRQGPGSPQGDPAKVNMPPRRTWLTFMLVLLANFLLVRLLFPSAQPVKVPSTLFRDEVGRKNVQAIYSRGASITGRFAKPVTYPRDSAEAARMRGRTRSRVEPRPVTDFATSWTCETTGFSDGERREVIVKEKALALHAAGKCVEILRFLCWPEGCDRDILRVAALECCGTVNPWQNADLR